MMEPHEVLAMFDLWPAPESPSQSRSGLQLQVSTGLVARTMSVGDSRRWQVESEVLARPVRGRPAWAVRIGFDGDPRNTREWAFDAETGVVIGRNAGAQYDTTEVADLIVGRPIDPAVFEYDGDFIDAQTAADQRQAAADEEASFRESYGAGNTVDRYLEAEYGTVMVRTDFSDDERWQDLVDDVNDDRDGVMGAGIPVIDNRIYEGWSVPDFLEAFARTPRNIVIAGPDAFADSDRLVTYLRITPAEADWTERGTTRITTAESVALIQANLDISNLFLDEMTPDADGILRME